MLRHVALDAVDGFACLPEGQPEGVLLMLHGCHQSAPEFARDTRMAPGAARMGWITVWPQQSQRRNARCCWSWFSDTVRESNMLSAETQRLCELHGTERTHVAVAGFSAGGAMALRLAHDRPDLFRAAASHSGVAPGLAHGGFGALDTMAGDLTDPTPARIDVPVLALQGSADQVVHPVNANWIGTAADDCDIRILSGLGHAWSGGAGGGAYTDPDGPDATAAILSFVLERTSRIGRPAWAHLPRAV